MSVDLTMCIPKGTIIPLEEIREGTAETLHMILAGSPAPDVLVYSMDRGKLFPVHDALIGVESENVYVLSYRGSDDRVLVVDVHLEDEANYALTFSVGATRDASEYVLALSGALFVGTLLDLEIEDGGDSGRGNRNIRRASSCARSPFPVRAEASWRPVTSCSRDARHRQTRSGDGRSW